jgi:hypothetical protein
MPLSPGGATRDASDGSWTSTASFVDLKRGVCRSECRAAVVLQEDERVHVAYRIVGAALVIAQRGPWNLSL